MNDLSYQFITVNWQYRRIVKALCLPLTSCWEYGANLDNALLYLSSYFKKNKSLYYDNLILVRTHHDKKQWLLYVLEPKNSLINNK